MYVDVPLMQWFCLIAASVHLAAGRRLSSGVHRVATSTDHKVPGQVDQHAGAATWQPKVSLASCTPVQRKEKCSTRQGFPPECTGSPHPQLVFVAYAAYGHAAVR